MSKTNIDMCGCCREIWNNRNLKGVKLGKNTLYLCPDCYEEYIKPFNKIKNDITQHEGLAHSTGNVNVMILMTNIKNSIKEALS